MKKFHVMMTYQSLDSTVDLVTSYGLIQAGSGVHPVSYQISAGRSFPGVKATMM